jgi:MOSC domain-containing protein YiiM
LTDSGRLEAIWLKPAHRRPMESVPRATLQAGRGLLGSVHQGGRRQVTLIDQGAWRAAMRELGTELDPVARRANLLLSGVPLAESAERILRVGRCHIRIRGETRPCHFMDEALPGLRKALEVDWRGGVFGEVLDDGEIVPGDPVLWIGA